MGRYINPEGSGKERERLCKQVVLALRELMKQNEPDAHSRDLAAFIGVALVDIYETVESSVKAWEKRGYWVKADRFRLEWEWAQQAGERMQTAVCKDDWASVALAAAQTAQRLMKINVPARSRLSTPWEGAWEKLSASRSH